MCLGVLGESIIGRARENGCVEINCRNIRDYTEDKHNRVDDAPYGGGTGMIMQTQPIYDCFMSLCDELGKRPHLIYMSPQGKTLTQERVKELSQLDNVALLCGHYEGVDQRVIDEIVDEEISIGDYVLTGGELPALILADAYPVCCPVCLPTRTLSLLRATTAACLSIRSIHGRLSGTVRRYRSAYFGASRQYSKVAAGAKPQTDFGAPPRYARACGADRQG